MFGKGVAREMIKAVLCGLVYTLVVMAGSDSFCITSNLIAGLGAYFLVVSLCAAWMNRWLLSRFALPAPWPLVLPVTMLGLFYLPAYALLYGLQQALLAFCCVLGALAVVTFVWYVHRERKER